MTAGNAAGETGRGNRGTVVRPTRALALSHYCPGRHGPTWPSGPARLSVAVKTRSAGRTRCPRPSWRLRPPPRALWVSEPTQVGLGPAGRAGVSALLAAARQLRVRFEGLLSRPPRRPPRQPPRRRDHAARPPAGPARGRTGEATAERRRGGGPQKPGLPRRRASETRPAAAGMTRCNDRAGRPTTRTTTSSRPGRTEAAARHPFESEPGSGPPGPAGRRRHARCAPRLGPRAAPDAVAAAAAAAAWPSGRAGPGRAGSGRAVAVGVLRLRGGGARLGRGGKRAAEAAAAAAAALFATACIR